MEQPGLLSRAKRFRHKAGLRQVRFSLMLSEFRRAPKEGRREGRSGRGRDRAEVGGAHGEGTREGYTRKEKVDGEGEGEASR